MHADDSSGRHQHYHQDSNAWYERNQHYQQDSNAWYERHQHYQQDSNAWYERQEQNPGACWHRDPWHTTVDYNHG